MVLPPRNRKTAPSGNNIEPQAGDKKMLDPSPVYVIVGQDVTAKETQIKKIKTQLLGAQLADFNLDTLYAKEAGLKDIQERFLSIPLKNSLRIVVIKEAHLLKPESRDFILNFCKKPLAQLVLVLDFPQYDYKDEFFKNICAKANILRFKENAEPDTFTLSRQIELKKSDSALRLLNELLKQGQAPERILGGLRYAWEKHDIRGRYAQKRLKMLLGADLEIKTGRLKPAFALEKLVVSLCSLP